MASLFSSSAMAWKPPTLTSSPFQYPSSTSSGSAASQPSAASPAAIKCSDCGQEVLLDDLGSHICAPAPSSQSTHSSNSVPGAPNSNGERQPPLLSQDAKYRAKASGLKIATSPLQNSPRMLQAGPAPSPALRSSPAVGTPGASWGHLSPRPPMERSASAGSHRLNLPPVSPGGTQAPSSLPFFDKYNKLYGATPSPASSSSSYFAPRSPSAGQQSQPNSANHSAFFTSSSSHSSFDGDSLRLRGSSDQPDSRCTSPDVAEPLYDGADFDSPGSKTGARQPFYSISNLNSHPQQQPKYPQPYFSASKSEPHSLASLAAPPVRHNSSSSSRKQGIQQLDHLLEDFDLNSGPDMAAASRSPSSHKATEPSLSAAEMHRQQMQPREIPPPRDCEAYASASMDALSTSNTVATPAEENAEASRTPRPAPRHQRTLSAPRTLRCANCRRNAPRDTMHFQPGEGKRESTCSLCQACYVHLYLPKCRKCTRPIQGKAIGSGDGKVKGKFHPGCFSCFSCSEPFPTGEFYVFEEEPYCYRHYHKLAGSTCVSCQDGIEGPCVSLPASNHSQPRRYHVDHFTCSQPRCSILLSEYHFVVDDLPYCEQHALQKSAATAAGAGPHNKVSSSNSRPEKRKTLVQPINYRPRY